MGNIFSRRPKRHREIPHSLVIPPNKEVPPKVEDRVEQLIRQAKRDLGMDIVNHINIAIVGNSGVGKSSLVNALIGLRNKHPNAAQVGVVETTLSMKRYPHPKNPHIIIWDIPGAGTLRMPASEYFDKNKLWGFDAVLIVSSIRFAEVDFQVFKKLQEFNVPCVFVRTKADQSLVSLVQNETASDMRVAASLLREQVKRDFETQIKLAGAPQSRGLYIVCANGIRNINGKKPDNSYVYYNIDEDILDTSLQSIGMDERALEHFLLESIKPRLVD